MDYKQKELIWKSEAKFYEATKGIITDVFLYENPTPGEMLGALNKIRNLIVEIETNYDNEGIGLGVRDFNN
jgi:hypothetical protein